MKRFKVEKDEYLNVWIVWELINNHTYNQVYSSMLKRECMEYVRNKRGKIIK